MALRIIQILKRLISMIDKGVTLLEVKEYVISALDEAEAADSGHTALREENAKLREENTQLTNAYADSQHELARLKGTQAHPTTYAEIDQALLAVYLVQEEKKPFMLPDKMSKARFDSCIHRLWKQGFVHIPDEQWALDDNFPLIAQKGIDRLLEQKIIE